MQALNNPTTRAKLLKVNENFKNGTLKSNGRAGVSEDGKVDKSDPNVKRLVYNTYREMLGAYNNKANDMIATLPRNMVREDKGVSRQLESIS